MMQDDDDDDDDNDDPMILNNKAKNHTSERTIVPWTVIFFIAFDQTGQKRFYKQQMLDIAGRCPITYFAIVFL